MAVVCIKLTKYKYLLKIFSWNQSFYSKILGKIDEFLSLIAMLLILWSAAKSEKKGKEVKTFLVRGHSMTTWTRRGGRWSKKSLFLSTFRVKNVRVEVSGGQKRAKLCPRSHWMPPFDQAVSKYSQCHLADQNAICILHRSHCAWLCCLLSQWNLYHMPHSPFSLCDPNNKHIC